MNNLFILVILLIACIDSTSGQLCYLCQDCPFPFWRDTSRVFEQQSSTGFCAKKSYDAFSGAKASRGPAEYGLCRTSGRTIIYDNVGRAIYVDCCRSNYCNTASFTSKSTIAVLLGALALLAVNRHI